MAKSTYGRIVIRHNREQGDVTRVESLAGEANITPGELLEYTTARAFLRHNTAGGPVAPKLIALETQTPDDEDDWTIDVDYANGDSVYAAIAQPGEQYYMFLAAGENAAINALLESDGDGALQVEAAVDATDVVHALVGRAVAAVNNSGGGSPVRIVVEII